jgi:hypothetical protein
MTQDTSYFDLKKPLVAVVMAGVMVIERGRVLLDSGFMP